jgi:30S ribosomal protein S31
MGKGDKKSKRGKIIRGSFGVRRHKKAKKSVVPGNSGSAVKIAEEKLAATQSSPEVKATTEKIEKPRTAAKKTAKPAAPKAVKTAKADGEQAAKPAARAKQPAAKKEE